MSMPCRSQSAREAALQQPAAQHSPMSHVACFTCVLAGMQDTVRPWAVRCSRLHQAGSRTQSNELAVWRGWLLGCCLHCYGCALTLLATSRLHVMLGTPPRHPVRSMAPHLTNPAQHHRVSPCQARQCHTPADITDSTPAHAEGMSHLLCIVIRHAISPTTCPSMS